WRWTLDPAIRSWKVRGKADYVVRVPVWTSGGKGVGRTTRRRRSPTRLNIQVLLLAGAQMPHEAMRLMARQLSGRANLAVTDRSLPAMKCVRRRVGGCCPDRGDGVS